MEIVFIVHNFTVLVCEQQILVINHFRFLGWGWQVHSLVALCSTEARVASLFQTLSEDFLKLFFGTWSPSMYVGFSTFLGLRNGFISGHYLLHFLSFLIISRVSHESQKNSKNSGHAKHSSTAYIGLDSLKS
jgi:hypothetical protein